MNNYNIECYFTIEGKKTIVRQSNGTALANVGAVLFKDKNNFISQNKKRLTFVSISRNTSLIYTGIPYTYLNNTFTTDYTGEITADNYVYVNITHSDEEDIASVYKINITANPTDNKFNIKTNGDIEFDGFILVNLPHKKTDGDLEEYTEKSNPTLLGVVFFNDNKPKIKYNQVKEVSYSPELHLILDEDIELTNSDLTYKDDEGETITDDTIGLRTTLGLRKVNTRNNGVDTLGTDNNILISNTQPDNFTIQDTFAKLGIMTPVMDGDTSNQIPQLVLGQTNIEDGIETWNGNRIEFLYNQNRGINHFYIQQSSQTEADKLNVNMFGIMQPITDPNSFGNFFLQSDSNLLYDTLINNSFIHSNNNIVAPRTNNVYFTDSIHNKLEVQENDYKIQNLSLYNCVENNINVRYWEPDYKDVFEATIENGLFINVKGCKINGYTNTNQNEGSGSRFTLINNVSSVYNFDDTLNNFINIGGKFNIADLPIDNTILIGNGLMTYGGDTIIMGNYNAPIGMGDVFVIGDGFCKKSYSDLNAYENATIGDNIEYTTNNPNNSDYYRHNIFTVNKKGYIKISDYNNKDNYAYYGYNGISAHYIDNSNNTQNIAINFTDLATYLNNTENQAHLFRETLESYTNQLTDIINGVPSTDVVEIAGNGDATYDSSESKWIYNLPGIDSFTNEVVNVVYRPVTDSSPTIIYVKWNVDNSTYSGMRALGKYESFRIVRYNDGTTQQYKPVYYPIQS